MSQKAVVVNKLAEPLIEVTRPIPSPQEGQLLVKVSIVGLNPHDGYAREWGLFIASSLPTPMGIDVVGTVQKVGRGVSNFSVGDRVLTLGTPLIPGHNGTQEYMIAREIATSHVPAGFTDDEIDTLILNPITSYFALFSAQGFNWPSPSPAGNPEDAEHKAFDAANQKILIVGGGSACGKFALQWSKFVGIGTIITIASKSKSEASLKALGATHVIERNQSDDEIVGQIRDIVGDDLVNALDVVNKGDRQTLGALALSNTKKGTLVCLVHAGSVNEDALKNKTGGFERKMLIADTSVSPEENAGYWKNLKKWIEDGVISPTPFEVIEGLDVEKINEAFDRYRDGKPITKPQIHVS